MSADGKLTIVKNNLTAGHLTEAELTELGTDVTGLDERELRQVSRFSRVMYVRQS